MSAPDAKTVLAGLLRTAGLDEATLNDVSLSGSEPVLPSSFATGTAAQATVATSALAAANLWRLRTCKRQLVSVDMRHAAVEFRSERYLQIDGAPYEEYHDDIAGLYRCGDGRWVRLHTNLPHHCSGLLALLQCPHDKAAVQRALDGWQGEALETAAAEAGLVVTACRSFDEWDRHPQGRAVASLPLFTIERIGDAPAVPLGAAERPLSGVKVVDLTRIIAGPVCGRTLAAHGADVMLVTASHLPSLFPLVVDIARFAPSRRARGAHGAGAGRRHFRARLPARRHRRAQLWPAGCCAAAAGDHLCLALRLWPCRTVGEPTRFRLAGANRKRLERGGSRSVRAKRAKSSSRPRARPCHRLSARLRHHGGAGAPRQGRRLLARALLAGADLSLVPPSRPHRRHVLSRPAIR